MEVGLSWLSSECSLIMFCGIFGRVCDGVIDLSLLSEDLDLPECNQV